LLTSGQRIVPDGGACFDQSFPRRRVFVGSVILTVLLNLTTALSFDCYVIINEINDWDEERTGTAALLPRSGTRPTGPPWPTPSPTPPAPLGETTTGPLLGSQGFMRIKKAPESRGGAYPRPWMRGKVGSDRAAEVELLQAGLPPPAPPRGAGALFQLDGGGRMKPPPTPHPPLGHPHPALGGEGVTCRFPRVYITPPSSPRHGPLGTPPPPSPRPKAPWRASWGSSSNSSSSSPRPTSSPTPPSEVRPVARAATLNDRIYSFASKQS